jgi:hypothetical protein
LHSHITDYVSHANISGRQGSPKRAAQRNVARVRCHLPHLHRFAIGRRVCSTRLDADGDRHRQGDDALTMPSQNRVRITRAHLEPSTKTHQRVSRAQTRKRRRGLPSRSGDSCVPGLARPPSGRLGKCRSMGAPICALWSREDPVNEENDCSYSGACGRAGHVRLLDVAAETGTLAGGAIGAGSGAPSW